MNAIEDRLSHIAALRPRSPVATLPAGANAGNSELLLQLLKGENRTTRWGRHVRLQRRFSQPAARALSERALRLMNGDSAEHLSDSVAQDCSPGDALR